LIYSVAVYPGVDHGKQFVFSFGYIYLLIFYFSERVVYMPSAQPMYGPQGYPGQPMYGPQGYPGQPMYGPQGYPYVVREPMQRY